MPVSRGFGTGGLQITLALIGPDDVLKVIDQGADDSVNAVAMRAFITRMAPGVEATTDTRRATLIQTRHRIPETPLRPGQIMIYQVPIPDCLTVIEPSEARRREMHAEADYARLYVHLYEDLVRFREIRLSSRYPLRIHGRYIMDPSPIPRFDNPRLHRSPALHLFGAGREKRLYAVPPWTDAVSLAFADVPFRVEDFRDDQGRRRRCVRCGADDSYLDECPGPAGGETIWRCSDSERCARTAAAGGRP